MGRFIGRGGSSTFQGISRDSIGNTRGLGDRGHVMNPLGSPKTGGYQSGGYILNGDSTIIPRDNGSELEYFFVTVYNAAVQLKNYLNKPGGSRDLGGSRPFE